MGHWGPLGAGGGWPRLPLAAFDPLVDGRAGRLADGACYRRVVGFTVGGAMTPFFDQDPLATRLVAPLHLHFSVRSARFPR